MEPSEQRTVTSNEHPEDLNEGSLRPRYLSEMIGQNRIKENLGILIEAARGREEAIDHLLFYGPPGLGKTTLAHIMAILSHVVGRAWFRYWPPDEIGPVR